VSSHVVDPILLASTSPQRRVILEQLDLPFDVVAPDYEEHDPPGADVYDLVREHARGKARSVAQLGGLHRPVLGVDTAVAIGGAILGKPANAAEAAEMLRRLQGRTHEVWTGLAVTRDREQRTAAECTRVQFASMNEAEIQGYVRTGEPLDKAGAYGIQGLGAAFVRGIEGDYYNVVGLPLRRLRRILMEFE
jgi:septum formation protein